MGVLARNFFVTALLPIPAFARVAADAEGSPQGQTLWPYLNFPESASVGNTFRGSRGGTPAEIADFKRQQKAKFEEHFWENIVAAKIPSPILEALRGWSENAERTQSAHSSICGIFARALSKVVGAKSNPQRILDTDWQPVEGEPLVPPRRRGQLRRAGLGPTWRRRYNGRWWQLQVRRDTLVKPANLGRPAFDTSRDLFTSFAVNLRSHKDDPNCPLDHSVYEFEFRSEALSYPGWLNGYGQDGYRGGVVDLTNLMTALGQRSHQRSLQWARVGHQSSLQVALDHEGRIETTWVMSPSRHRLSKRHAYKEEYLISPDGSYNSDNIVVPGEPSVEIRRQMADAFAPMLELENIGKEEWVRASAPPAPPAE